MIAVEALPLDPAGYPGSYKLVGGRRSLDLINTVSWAGTDREHDWLSSPANLAAWLAAVGLPATFAAPEEARNVRRTIAAVLRPIARGAAPEPSAVERFNRLLATALSRRRIDPGSLEWTWETSTDTTGALAPVVLDTAVLLAGDHARIKHCPACRWLFEDQTRNGRRRWCDMADCGSRAKSAAYYRRRRA